MHELRYATADLLVLAVPWKTENTMPELSTGLDPHAWEQQKAATIWRTSENQRAGLGPEAAVPTLSLVG